MQRTVALVTGASRGVGKGIAQELIDKGAEVYATGRTVEDLNSLGDKAHVIRCDHRDDTQVERVFRHIEFQIVYNGSK
jgi:dehydrogenase/reductase SDR family protein 1